MTAPNSSSKDVDWRPNAHSPHNRPARDARKSGSSATASSGRSPRHSHAGCNRDRNRNLAKETVDQAANTMGLMVQQLISELVFAPRDLLPGLRQYYADCIFDLIALRDEPDRPRLLEAFLFHGPLGIQQDVDAWFRSQPPDPFHVARAYSRRPSSTVGASSAPHGTASGGKAESPFDPQRDSSPGAAPQPKDELEVKKHSEVELESSHMGHVTRNDQDNDAQEREEKTARAPATAQSSSPAPLTSDQVESLIDGVLVHQIVAAEAMADFFRLLFPPMDALPAKWDPDNCLQEALMRVFRRQLPATATHTQRNVVDYFRHRFLAKLYPLRPHMDDCWWVEAMVVAFESAWRLTGHEHTSRADECDVGTGRSKIRALKDSDQASHKEGSAFESKPHDHVELIMALKRVACWLLRSEPRLRARVKEGVVSCDGQPTLPVGPAIVADEETRRAVFGDSRQQCINENGDEGASHRRTSPEVQETRQCSTSESAATARQHSSNNSRPIDVARWNYWKTRYTTLVSRLEFTPDSDVYRGCVRMERISDPGLPPATADPSNASIATVAAS